MRENVTRTIHIRVPLPNPHKSTTYILLVLMVTRRFVDFNRITFCSAIAHRKLHCKVNGSISRNKCMNIKTKRTKQIQIALISQTLYWSRTNAITLTVYAECICVSDINMRCTQQQSAFCLYFQSTIFDSTHISYIFKQDAEKGETACRNVFANDSSNILTLWACRLALLGFISG